MTVADPGNAGTSDTDNAAQANNLPTDETPVAAAPATKASRHADKSNTDDDSSAIASDPTAGTTTSQAQAAPSPTPAAAAVVGANTDQSTAQPSANASTPTLAIGDQGKGHAKAALVSGGNQNVASGPDATDAAMGTQPAPATQPNNATSAPADSSGGGKVRTADTGPTQDTQTQSSNVASTAASPDGSATTSGARTAAPSTPTASGTSEASNTQTGANPTKSDAAGLPNFGFSAAAAPTASTTAATASTTTNADAAVPVAGLAVAIAARAQSGSNQFDIRLDPPELGRIDVRLDVDSGGQATTHITADRADTLQLLQSQQPQLQSALEQAGLKTADNGLQFTLRDQSFAGQNNGSGQQQQNNSAQLVIPDPDLPPVSATQIYSRTGLGGGVDIRV